MCADVPRIDAASSLRVTRVDKESEVVDDVRTVA
jgi:hypothetical protein